MLVESVPNFSTADPAVVDALIEAVSSMEAIVLDHSADQDHNRAVLTLAGPPAAVAEALMRAAAVAVDRIDLRSHRGAHPRMGALDVAPFVAVRGITEAQLVERARAFGRRLWDELRVPAYFYGSAALREERSRLEDIRRGGFEALAADAGRTRPPDVGGPAAHATAGAAAVGVRPFLIAFNVNLATPDVGVARSIARRIRESSGGYPAVKALGLELPSSGLTQVSMNLTDFRKTPPKTVFDRIVAEAASAGVETVESELIGLIPEAALNGTSGEKLLIRGFDAERMIFERRLASLMVQQR